MKPISSKSPKNKFIATVTFLKPVKELGSSCTTGGMTKEEVKFKTLFYTKQSESECFISIKENKSEYPNFDWQIVEEYTVKK